MHFPVLRPMRYSLVNHPLWTLLLWLGHRTLTHKFKLSSPPHLLHWSWKLSHWLTLALHFTVTRPQEHNTPSSHWHANVLCLTPFMVCPIQESEAPEAHYVAVCMAWYVRRCLLLDPFLCTVPMCQDSATLYRPTMHLPSQTLMLVLISSTLTS